MGLCEFYMGWSVIKMVFTYLPLHQASSLLDVVFHKIWFKKKVLMNLWCESWKQTKAWMPITLEQKVVVMVEQSQCKWHVKPQWHLITRQLRLHHNHIAQLHEWNAIWHSVGVSPGYSLNIIGSSKYHNLQHSWYKIGGICIKKYTLWEIVFASDCLSKPIRWLEQFMSAA